MSSSNFLHHLLVSLELTAPHYFDMTTAMPKEYFLAEQWSNLMANTAYAASATFLAAHEWSSNGPADILATTESVNSLDPAVTPTSTRIRIVGQALDNPRLLKLKNARNYNDRFFPMSDSKWVIHLRKPKATVFEHDWNLALHNLQALEQRVATSQGANMLVYGPNDSLKDFRTTAPCFLPNVHDDNDPALVAYIPKVDRRYRDDMQELNPWWMLNVMQIVDIKGQKIAVGSPQEMSIRKSLVELSFTIKHNFIKSSTIDSFSATMCGVRIIVPGLHYSNTMTEMTAVGHAPARAVPAQTPAIVANSSGTPVTAFNAVDVATTPANTPIMPAPGTIVANTDITHDVITVLDNDKKTPTASFSTANSCTTDDGGRIKQKMTEPVQPKPKKSWV